MLGALAGAMVFEQLMSMGAKDGEKTQLAQLLQQGGNLPQDKNALHKLLNTQFKLTLTPEEFMLYAGAGLLGFTAILELIVNWKSDLSKIYPETWQDLSLLTAQPAIMSGLLIGAAQYIQMFWYDKQLGCSFTFVELCQLGFKTLRPSLASLKNPQVDEICNGTCDNIANPQQQPKPITAIGMTLGAFFGMLTSLSFYVGRNATDYPNHNIIVLILRLFIGGFLAVFGARVAGGCTSGIGLSYTSVGSSTGAAGMCAMFGAAIMAGIIFKIVGFGF